MPDSDPRLETFLDLATRSLQADPHARHEARDELLVRVISAEEAGAASEQLSRRRSGRTQLFAILSFSALILLGIPAAFLVHKTVREMQPLKNIVWDEYRLDELEVSPESEGAFVNARLPQNAATELHRLERLVQERPDDPGLFEEYTGLSTASINKLPPNYHGTWQRIDPGNGAWILRESIMKADDAFKGNGGSGPVTNETSFLEALALLNQAANAERFEIHDSDLLRRRLALTPAPEVLADEVRNVLFIISNHDASRSRIQQFGGAMIREQAKRLADAGDKEGLRDLIRTWRKLSLSLARHSSSLLDSVTSIGIAIHGKESLLNAATRLGLMEEQDLLNAVDDLGRDVTPIFRASPNRKSLSWMAGGSGMASPPPGIAGDPALAIPSRKVEYALADRLYALGSATLCLLLLAIAAIEAIRRGRVMNAVADGLAPLFRRMDSLWILGAGLLAPAVFYWSITRLTPFGCRDIGALYYPLPPSALQALAGLLLTWASLQAVVRWRVTSRISFLGAGRSGLPIDIGMVIWLGMLIAAIGGVRWMGKNEEHYLKAMAAACGLPFLWLVWQAGAVLLAPRSAALPGILLARKLILPLALLAAILLGAVPALRGMEQHWLQQDTLGRAPLNGWGPTMSEELSCRWIMDRFEEALGKGR